MDIKNEEETMDQIISLMGNFNLSNILSMAAIMWYFTRDIKQSIDNLDKDVRDMNTRISRIEGTVYGKEVYEKTSTIK
jgi:flagellar capping protein FliD